MAQNSVVVIDGSNIATEGRSLPSLAQLDEAVRSFLEEFPHDQFIVVVDATFEHRIDPSERRMYDDALAANELLTPPAGTIGRGDAFILAIAEKADATVFSNDSFQEFHGEFDWLFEEGRLIGGKPVPVIGWVFTARTPVRGQKSRQATREATKRRTRGGTKASATGPRATPRSASSPAANLPMPTPKAPPPRPAKSAAASDTEEAAAGAGGSGGRNERSRRSARKRTAAPEREPVNEGLAFVTFISEHAVGETVEGEVTEFSSHGAYVSVGETRCYVPLKYLGSPPPRAARDVLERSEVRSFVVQAIDGPRRAIDLALPGFEQLDGATDVAEGVDEDDEPVRTTGQEPVPRRRTRKKAAAPVEVGDVDAAPVTGGEESEPAPRRRTRKKAAAPVEGLQAEDLTTSRQQVPPRGRGRKVPAPPLEAVDGRSGDDANAVDAPEDERASDRPDVATPAPAKRSTSRKAPTKKAAPKKSPATGSTAEAASADSAAADGTTTAGAPMTTDGAPATTDATNAPTEKAPSRKAPSRRAPADKTAAPKKQATKAAAAKSATKKSTTKKATAKKATAGNATAGNATARKATAGKATAGKATAAKTTAKKAPAGAAATSSDGTGEPVPTRKRVAKKAAPPS